VVKFTFITEDGTETLTYDEYLKRPELMAKIADKRRVFLNLGLTLISYDKRWLAGQPTAKIRDVEAIKADLTANPIKYFFPQGARSPIGKSAAAMFINDMAHTVTGIISGNRYGKSTCACAKLMLGAAVIPTDPNWPVFKDHGIQYREWTGPKEVGIASYNWVNIYETVWPQVVRAWFPDSELGKYAQWSAPRDSAFSVRLTCGSVLHFKCASQPQSAFESQALDDFWWDEQGTEEKFIGANERVATRRGHHFFSLTPHRLEDRPDTGAGSWIHRMVKGEETKGLSSKFFPGNLLRDVPDWIYPEETKREKIKQWVDEPRRLRNRKKEREGRSRLFGDWHESSGLVYDDYEREIHVIPPRNIPIAWTSYRGIDHGRVNPCACVAGSVNPADELFIHGEYYEPDRLVHQNVAGIVKMSGNKLVSCGTMRDGFAHLRSQA
jgi:hypothetical protein